MNALHPTPRFAARFASSESGPWGCLGRLLGYHADREWWSVTAYVENVSNTTVLNVVTPQPLAGEAIFTVLIQNDSL
jgi:hypothetical protein